MRDRMPEAVVLLGVTLRRGANHLTLVGAGTETYDFSAADFVAATHKVVSQSVLTPCHAIPVQPAL